MSSWFRHWKILRGATCFARRLRGEELESCGARRPGTLSRRQVVFLQGVSMFAPSEFGILPEYKDGHGESDELKKKREQMGKRLDSIPRLSKAELNARSRGNQEDRVFQIIEGFKAYSRASDEYYKLLADSEDKALDEAKKERERAESWYKRSTVASYFLYTLGWGLGLVGKLFGSDGSGGE